MPFKFNPITHKLDLVDTNNIPPPLARFPITPYVVGPSGQAGYQTIQSALNAANAAGGGSVYVQPGTYTENLTLYDNTQIAGAVAYETAGNIQITGVHTPPATGTFAFANLQLNSATDIFNSAVAGSAALGIDQCTINVTNGFLFNLPNWTGALNVNDCGSIGTNDGVVNNSGGASVFFNNCQVGAGTGQTFVANGPVRLDLCFVVPPITLTNASLFFNFALFENTLTLAGTSNGTIFLGDFFPISGPAITMSSSGAVSIFSTSITTSNNPAISGSGSGLLTLGEITFLGNATIAGTLNVIGAGGFIASQLTNQGVVLGQGANPIAATAAGLNGQVLIGGNASNPAFATIASPDSSISFVAGVNTLSMTVTGGATVGKTMTGNSGGARPPTAGNWNIVGSGGVAVAGSGNTLTVSVSGAGLTWSRISGSGSLAINNGYIAVSPGGALSLSLPASSNTGDIIELVLDGATSWTITQGASQQVRVGNVTTTLGAGGSIASTAQGDGIRLVCQTANTLWVATPSPVGSLTIV